jgi:hypothetical protein
MAGIHLAECINQTVLETGLNHKTNRQLDIFMSNSKQSVDDLVGGGNFLKPSD